MKSLTTVGLGTSVHIVERNGKSHRAELSASKEMGTMVHDVATASLQ